MVANTHLTKTELVDAGVDREVAKLLRCTVEVRCTASAGCQWDGLALVARLTEVEGALVRIVAIVVRFAASAANVEDAGASIAALPLIASIARRSTGDRELTRGLSRGAAAKHLTVKARP